MDKSRLNKNVFYWSNNKYGNRCKNWHFRVCKLLKEFDSSELFDISIEISKKATLDKILPLITQHFIDQQLVDVNLVS